MKKETEEFHSLGDVNLRLHEGLTNSVVRLLTTVGSVKCPTIVTLDRSKRTRSSSLPSSYRPTYEKSTLSRDHP